MKRSSWKPRDFNVAAANQDTSLDDSNDNDDLEAGTIAGWHFEDDDKSWKAYNDNDQGRLESAYRAHQKFLASSTSDRTKKPPTVVKIQSLDWLYEVDVEKMVQTNVQHPDHRQRKIKREVPAPSSF